MLHFCNFQLQSVITAQETLLLHIDSQLLLIFESQNFLPDNGLHSDQMAVCCSLGQLWGLYVGRLSGIQASCLLLGSVTHTEKSELGGRGAVDTFSHASCQFHIRHPQNSTHRDFTFKKSPYFCAPLGRGTTVLCVCAQSLSCVQLFATPRTVAC